DPAAAVRADQGPGHGGDERGVLRPEDAREGAPHVPHGGGGRRRQGADRGVDLGRQGGGRAHPQSLRLRGVGVEARPVTPASPVLRPRSDWALILRQNGEMAMADGSVMIAEEARAKAYSTPLEAFAVANSELFCTDTLLPSFERLR